MAAERIGGIVKQGGEESRVLPDKARGMGWDEKRGREGFIRQGERKGMGREEGRGGVHNPCA